MNSEEERRKLRDLINSLKTSSNNASKISFIEFDTVLLLGQQMGISKLEFLQLFQRYLTAYPPKHEDSRFEQFQRLLLILNAYDCVVQSELDLIKLLAIRMGLHPEGTDLLLSLMKEYPNGKIPKEKFEAIFSPFKN